MNIQGSIIKIFVNSFNIENYRQNFHTYNKYKLLYINNNTRKNIIDITDRDGFIKIDFKFPYEQNIINTIHYYYNNMDNDDKMETYNHSGGLVPNVPLDYINIIYKDLHDIEYHLIMDVYNMNINIRRISVVQ